MFAEEPSELQKTFQRDINCLLDEDRNLRRQGLTSINQKLFKPENSEQDIHQLFHKVLTKNVLKVMSDKVEKNREIAIEIIGKFFDRVKNVETELVSSVLKEVILRLNITPFPEQSEEIRLQLLHLLMKIFKEGYSQAFVWNLSDISFTVSKILLDNFADAKKDASQFVTQLSNGLKDTIGSHSSPIIKALAVNLSHQHSKVRKVTVDSLGEILLTKNAGVHLKEVMPFLKQVANDKLSDVRKSTYVIVAKLLNQFSPAFLRDYETELVQLLLNGLSDDNEEIVKATEELLEQAGKNIRDMEMHE